MVKGPQNNIFAARRFSDKLFFTCCHALHIFLAETEIFIKGVKGTRSWVKEQLSPNLPSGPKSNIKTHLLKSSAAIELCTFYLNLPPSGPEYCQRGSGVCHKHPSVTAAAVVRIVRVSQHAPGFSMS